MSFLLFVFYSVGLWFPSLSMDQLLIGTQYVIFWATCTLFFVLTLTISVNEYLVLFHYSTGLVCDAESANEVHKYIRSVLSKMYDDEVAQNMRIQYGGSVTPDSVDGLMAMSDIDGCLVGGASLYADKFARIVNFQPQE